MDELVNKVAEKTGVGADTVRTVLTTAADFIKQKLPPPLAGQVDMLLKGGGGAGGPGSNPDPLAAVAGMFGGK
jgi:hypothetical protein